MRIAAQETERQDDRCDSRRDGDERIEPEVGREHDEQRAQREPGSHGGEPDQERGDCDRERQAPAVVPLDPVLECLERLDRVVRRHRAQAPGRDVRHRDEPVEPRRVGGEQASSPRSAIG